MSNRNQRTKDRRHRRMEEARAEARVLSKQMNQTNDAEELKKIQERYFNARSRSTRKANHL